MVLRLSYQKHPHACGEDPTIRKEQSEIQETPPRLWGRQALLHRPQPQSGNTPTPVGKTEAGMLWLNRTKKHPHACGEDELIKPLASTTAETPPRLWGRLLQMCTCPGLTRNTPTPVGKTKGKESWNNSFWKHPHACGEDPSSTAILSEE